MAGRHRHVPFRSSAPHRALHPRQQGSHQLRSDDGRSEGADEAVEADVVADVARGHASGGIHMRREQPGSRTLRKAAERRREIYAVAALLTGAIAVGRADSPTFTKDVLPILQKNCQTCHRAGQIAPMSLVSYEEARPWARSIKTKVESRQMPPWFADPAHGQFANDRSLPQRDIETIAKWVDAGAPQG